MMLLLDFPLLLHVFLAGLLDQEGRIAYNSLGVLFARDDNLVDV